MIWEDEPSADCWGTFFVAGAFRYTSIMHSMFGTLIFSRRSLLWIWKSRCLNSHAWILEMSSDRNYSFAIRIDSSFLIVPYFVEIVSKVRKGLYMAACLFNCRTKLAKLECLKWRGNTLLVNSLFYTRGRLAYAIDCRLKGESTSRTIKLSPMSLHRTTC